MGLDLDYIDGQTPIEEEEKEELMIKTISTRGELDEFEQQNIEKAIEWTLNRKFGINEILQEKFIIKVHKQMFSNVWKWAGKFRKTNKNIGVDKFQISTEIKYLLDNCNYWIENKTYNNDEITIRFKHRLVQIHLFPNGNGRHSRLCADILISHGFGESIFSWSGKDLTKRGIARTKYLSAISEADKGNFKPLLEFARS